MRISKSTAYDLPVDSMRIFECVRARMLEPHEAVRLELAQRNLPVVTWQRNVLAVVVLVNALAWFLVRQ